MLEALSSVPRSSGKNRLCDCCEKKALIKLLSVPRCSVCLVVCEKCFVCRLRVVYVLSISSG